MRIRKKTNDYIGVCPHRLVGDKCPVCMEKENKHHLIPKYDEDDEYGYYGFSVSLKPVKE